MIHDMSMPLYIITEELVLFLRDTWIQILAYIKCSTECSSGDCANFGRYPGHVR